MHWENSPVVLCADIGSVEQGRFGWARMDGVGYQDHTSHEIEHLSDSVAHDLNRGQRVALGFECPLAVPVRDDPATLTAARHGEGNRPWSAGAGASVLATGLAQVTWVLADIRRRLNGSIPAYLDWRPFREASGPALFIWEAFVTDRAKAKRGPNAHALDAVIANRAFRLALPDIDAANAVDEPEVFSLVGAALLRTGWTRDTAVLQQAPVVIKPATNRLETVGDLFAEKPDQWGLRGDVPMWIELETTHQSTPLPADLRELERLLHSEFERTVGVRLGSEEMTYVSRFAAGGMSSGYVSHEAWKDRLIPMLCERARERRMVND